MAHLQETSVSLQLLLQPGFPSWLEMDVEGDVQILQIDPINVWALTYAALSRSFEVVARMDVQVFIEHVAHHDEPDLHQ